MKLKLLSFLIAIIFIFLVTACEKQNDQSSSEAVSVVPESSSLPEASGDDDPNSYSLAFFLPANAADDPYYALTRAGALKATEDLKKQNIKVNFFDYKESDDESNIDLYDEVIKNKPDVVIDTFHLSKILVGKARIEGSYVVGANIHSYEKTYNEKKYYLDMICGFDNYGSGAAAREKIEELLKSQGKTSGKFGIIGFNKSTNFTRDRETGFMYSSKEITFEGALNPVYTDGDKVKSQKTVAKLIEENEDIVGIFVSNGDACEGAAMAISAAGLKDSIVLIGCGIQKRKYLEDGTIDAFIEVDPFELGYQAVVKSHDFLQDKTAMRKRKWKLGKKKEYIAEQVYIQSNIITKGNAAAYYSRMQQYYKGDKYKDFF